MMKSQEVVTTLSHKRKLFLTIDNKGRPKRSVPVVLYICRKYGSNKKRGLYIFYVWIKRLVKFFLSCRKVFCFLAHKLAE